MAAGLRFAPDAESVHLARQFIADFCRASQLPAELCETAALLVSELVTNAIVHGGTSATVEIHRPTDILRVAVRDDNPNLPPLGERPVIDADSGRGLMIVSLLAPRWGIEAADGGKAIWFELAVDGVTPA